MTVSLETFYTVSNLPNTLRQINYILIVISFSYTLVNMVLSYLSIRVPSSVEITLSVCHVFPTFPYVLRY